MHLIVPFAGVVSQAGQQALQTLALPQLDRLLSRLSPVQSLGSNEYSLSPPHELAQAAARGWPLTDGALPWAAELARQAGLTAGHGIGDHSDAHHAELKHGQRSDCCGAHRAWALLTPVHLHLGTDQVTLTDPAALQLDAAQSRQLFDAVHGLFESEGFLLHWLAADQWLAAHTLFADLPTASLDRVIGRNIDRWLPDQRPARLLRRLQNEVQMLLYTHALNLQREAAGQASVNSFWCSGTGPVLSSLGENGITGAKVARLDATAPGATSLGVAALDVITSDATVRPAGAPQPAPTEPTIDLRLRRAALAEDWAAWCEAWRSLDAGPVAALLAAVLTGKQRVQLTLCGERHATRFESAPSGGRLQAGARSLWQGLAGHWRAAASITVLEAL